MERPVETLTGSGAPLGFVVMNTPTFGNSNHSFHICHGCNTRNSNSDVINNDFRFPLRDVALATWDNPPNL